MSFSNFIEIFALIAHLSAWLSFRCKKFMNIHDIILTHCEALPSNMCTRPVILTYSFRIQRTVTIDSHCIFFSFIPFVRYRKNSATSVLLWNFWVLTVISNIPIRLIEQNQFSIQPFQVFDLFIPKLMFNTNINKYSTK